MYEKTIKLMTKLLENHNKQIEYLFNEIEKLKREKQEKFQDTNKIGPWKLQTKFDKIAVCIQEAIEKYAADNNIKYEQAIKDFKEYKEKVL